MSDGQGHSIPVGNQKYSASAFTYSSQGTALTGSDVLLGLHVLKTTTTGTPANKPIYWGIAIPNVLPSGSYIGKNTITAQVSTQTNW
jgi:hypothetical protein